MFFHNILYHANFEYADNFDGSAFRIGGDSFACDITEYQGDIYRIRIRNSRLWRKNYSQAPLTLPGQPDGAGSTVLAVTDKFGLELRTADGRTSLLKTSRGFGVNGPASLFYFLSEKKDRYYGMGEKSYGLEYTGRNAKFWNTDTWGDFHYDQVKNGEIDPMYVSVPYLVIKRGEHYIGLLLNNPCPSFISLAMNQKVANQMKMDSIDPVPPLIIGSEEGQPELFILYGRDLAQLTRRLNWLCGPTPLPPAWALGYHQCRWGYASAADLERLDRNFTKHQIPCDGLWLDIGYMERFKIFTFEKKNFPDLQSTVKKLNDKGRRIVPIIDPGVKNQTGYSVYDKGIKNKVFCQNRQGGEYVGLVWPGETVFPDFSLPRVRKWWADHCAAFFKLGMSGAWLDMNDPATGQAVNTDMLFNEGKESHATYHNQYAQGMARATEEGFHQAFPDRRHFLLSRSGYTGMGRYSAIWTGDNYANYHHLRMAVTQCMNMGLSGIPFNGPDIGGFGDDTWGEMMNDWIKCCFLFPFCRNHSNIRSRVQEPWVFGEKVTAVQRQYISLRYRLRPYLYNLFIAQEESGDIILRPLLYDFKTTAALPLDRLADQFMIGPSIMQAPFLIEKAKAREVLLPGKDSWFDAGSGKWLKPGRRIRVGNSNSGTPLYIKEGAVIPMDQIREGDNSFVPEKAEIHIYLRKTSKQKIEYIYKYDDGETYAYRKGKRTEVQIRAAVKKGVLEIESTATLSGYRDPDLQFIIYDDFKECRLNGQIVKVRATGWKFTGSRLKCKMALK